MDGVAGITGASSLTLTNNGGSDFVYVLGALDQSVAVFERDLSTGELTFIQFKQNGTGNVEGLSLAQDLILSYDELSLYVAGSEEDALVHFDRNMDGTLDFSNVLYDGDALLIPGENINGLDGASGLFISPDDSHVYVAANSDNSISSFNRDTVVTIGEIEYQQSLIDELGGVAPGTELTYFIVVSNAGPSDVEKAEIVDNFPPEFEQISYQCFPLDGAACDTNIKFGNVNEVADLPVGSKVEIRATGVIRTGATGVLSNTATVASSSDPSFTITDPDITNNTSTDDDTLLSPAVNLIVTKENGVNNVVPGTPVSYTITVANNAVLPGNNKPSDITDVSISDVVPESIINVNWTCEAFPQPGLLDDGDEFANNFVTYTDLNQHYEMIISQQGTHAYVTGVSSGVSTLLVYERNFRTGTLIEIQRITNSTANVSGLGGAQGLLLSSDQKQLYVVSEIDDSIVTFNVDTQSSLLSHAATQTDGLFGVNGIGGAKDLVASNDGRHIYVAGKLDNAIAIFNRNIVNGALTYNTLITGFEGLNGVEAMLFDEVGKYLLVVAESNNSLATFERDVSSGLLTPVDVIQDFEIPSSVLEQPKDLVINGNSIIVASYVSNAISQFSLDPENGDLIYQSAITHGDAGVGSLQGPVSLKFGNSGKELYVSSQVSESISMFGFIDNQLSPINQIYDTSIIAGLDNLSNLLIDPLGGFLYALSDDLVLANLLKGSTCTSAGTGSLSDLADISSGGYLTYTLTGDVLPTATGLLSNTATALVGSGFIELNNIDNSSEDVDTLTPVSDASISKTDNLIEVVAGTPLDYELSIFSSGPSTIIADVTDELPIFPATNAGFETGSITWQCLSNKTLQFNTEYTDDSTNGLLGVSDITISADGLFAYAVSSSNDSISVFSRNSLGELTFLELVTEGDSFDEEMVVSGLVGASAVVIDLSDTFVIVAGETANSLVVFARDSATGLLTYIQTLSSGTDGVIGMSGPVDVTISPENDAVYVAANGSDAITVFSRDIATGLLSFVERVRDGFGTIVPESNVIIGIREIKISPDGNFLYVASDSSDTLSIFARDRNTQILTFINTVRTGDNHDGNIVAGLDGVQSLTMSSNGEHLYAVATLDSSMLQFSRNAITGELSFENVLLATDLNSGELTAPTSVSITPDGDRIIVTDAASHSINLYDRAINTGDLTLVDVFTNNIDGSSLMIEPQLLLTDGTNILVVSNASSSLVALRITVTPTCEQGSGTGDIVNETYLMNPSSSGGINIQAMVHPSARGIISNTALIDLTVGSTDNDLLNNSSTDQTQIIVQTDVEVIKTGPAKAIAGEDIEYQIILTNTGPSDALDVQLSDALDASLLNATWVCSATGRSFCNDDNGSGSLNTIVNIGIDGQIEFVISATISSDFNGDLINSASAVVFEAGFNTDTELTNNISEVTTTVSMISEVEVSKTNSVDGVIAGEPVIYDIVVTNNGPSDAPNVMITDLIPDILTNITWTCSTGSSSSCSALGVDDISEVTYIAANSQLSYQVTANIKSDATGDLINTVTADVALPSIDEKLDNNSATDSDSISHEADMAVVLSSSINPYDPESPLFLPMLIDVVNNGPSDAENAMVTLIMTTDISLQSSSQCVYEIPFVICDIGRFKPGESYQFPLELQVIAVTPTQRIVEAENFIRYLRSRFTK